TGAVAVAGNLKTYYNDIKTGVADGTLTFTTGAWGCKCFEVAPHITKVNFGSQFAGGVSINKDTWEGFAPEVREVFQAVSNEYNVRFANAQQGAANALLAKMVKAGAKVAEFDAGERAKWAKMIPNVAKVWAAKLDGAGQPGSKVLQGFMAHLKASGADIPRDWSAE
ncbi:MAG: TRAP transporter substrate-binding protein DctP, partial [Alphaproteobacteria bacterium]|nr:TRAP transporter substrate-binding protein DctP [Alphaproteobacteria bacterium]